MPWVRIDDHFDEHPKIAQLGDSALALWVTGIAYSNRNLTDGFIPEMVGFGKLRYCLGGPADVITELVKAGLWEPTDGGWMIHDYTDYQPTRADVLREREAARERKQKSREKSQGKSQRDEDVTTDESHGGVTPPPNPNPIPKPKPEKPLAAKRRTRIPDDWMPTDDLLAWAAKEMPSVDAKAETVKFYDHHRGKGSTMIEWGLAWKNWMRRAAEFSSRNNTIPFRNPTEADYAEGW